jgi:hypothetical protein
MEPRRVRMRGGRAPHRRTAHTAHPPVRGCGVGCAVGGANPTPTGAPITIRGRGRGGPPTAVSRDRATGPHHPSKPAGRLSRYPTRTPPAVLRHVETRIRRPSGRSGPLMAYQSAIRAGRQSDAGPLASAGVPQRRPDSPSWLGRPLGGVERPRRAVRFARLIQRRVRVLGGPSVRAACGGNVNLNWLSRRVVASEQVTPRRSDARGQRTSRRASRWMPQR